MILQNHRRLPVCIFSVKIAALGSLKRVTGSNFKGASQYFAFDFLINQKTKKNKNHQRMYRKKKVPAFIITSLQEKYS
jgi:hypothetical protein